MSEQKSRTSIMWCWVHESNAAYDSLGGITECETHATGNAAPCDLDWGHVVRGLPEVTWPTPSQDDVSGITWEGGRR